jgi:small subunit ribosomal protein S3
VGQKVNPISFRLGIFEDWKAHWFKPFSGYAKELMDDFEVREYLKRRLNYRDVESVVIDKAADTLRVVIRSARPGVIIGKKGHGIERLKLAMRAKFGRVVDISVQEVRTVETSARIIANSIADQLVRRASYKKLMKRAGFAAMRAGARGIKICCSGRLAGAEIARSEWLRLGSIPLHTLRAKVDFAMAEAKTTYGVVGVKVWVCTGEF